MSKKTMHSSDWEANTVRNTVRLGFWTFGWVASMAVANFGPRLIWASNESLTLLALTLKFHTW